MLVASRPEKESPQEKNKLIPVIPPCIPIRHADESVELGLVTVAAEGKDLIKEITHKDETS